MSNFKKNFNLSHYLVVGPENCKYKPFSEVVLSALRAGFTFIQLRSKKASDRELLQLAAETAGLIAACGKSQEVSFVINDNVSVVKVAQERGIKVDGVHVGQTDASPVYCRKLLGDAAIIGLSAPQSGLADYLSSADCLDADYFGLAPLHETATKKDLVKGNDNTTIIPSFAEIVAFAQNSPLPVVLGGGVKKEDLPLLAKTPLAGYFVVSAVCAAENPYFAAVKLVHNWNENRAQKPT